MVWPDLGDVDELCCILQERECVCQSFDVAGPRHVGFARVAYHAETPEENKKPDEEYTCIRTALVVRAKVSLCQRCLKDQA